MSGEATAQISPVRVKSTQENLRAALGGEQHEIDALYPAFLSHATSRFDTSAARSFRWAIESEKSHARLYEDAIAAVALGKSDCWTKAAIEFYVCTLCGYTARTPEAQNCPPCNFLWARFEVIR
jgi:rubrerythrin